MSRLVCEIEFLTDEGEVERIEAVRQESFNPAWIQTARSGEARLHLLEMLEDGGKRNLFTISKETPH